MNGVLDAGAALPLAAPIPTLAPMSSPSGQTARVGFERDDLLLTTANALAAQARLVDAEAIYRALLVRDARNVRAMLGLAAVREKCGDVEEAVVICDQALEIAPNNPTIISGAIFPHDRRSAATPEDSYRLRRRFNDLVKRPIRPHLNTKAPDRPLRVGYVSGDMRHHSAALVFGVVLANHTEAVETYAYATHSRGDWLTDTLKARVPHWRQVGHWPDDLLEQQIRRDQIDVLVDLSGHTTGNRLALFARKPAPVQVTAWGYITGTGLDAMDYLFADEDTVYPDEERFYVEAIYRLPRIVSYWAAAPDVVGPVAPLPALANGHLTFGVVNRLGKCKPEAVALWCRVMAALPTARLIVKAPGLEEAQNREALSAVFGDCGADFSRLQFRGSTDHTEHMHAYNEIDVGLDPWLDSGGVSNLEALWMGVPCITLPHRQIASRLTTSFNRELGLPYFVASSADEYVERAVMLDRQWQELAAIRGQLRDVMSVSALCDHEAYVRAVEDAYRWMWQRWCAGLPSKPGPATVGAS